MSNSIPSVLNITEEKAKLLLGGEDSTTENNTKTGCRNESEPNYVCPCKLPCFHIAPHSLAENYKGTFAVRNYICTLSFGNHYHPLKHSYWYRWWNFVDIVCGLYNLFLQQ